jgi:hypothetical protein
MSQSSPSHPDEERRQFTVKIPFAIVNYNDSGMHVTYSIRAHDETKEIKWMVQRRFNDFKALHHHVGRHVPQCAKLFPGSGGILGFRTNTNKKSIEKRRAQLEAYFEALVFHLLTNATARQQRACRPLINKLLRYVEYPEYDDDPDNCAFWGGEAETFGEATPGDVRGADSLGPIVSTYIEEAFNASTPSSVPIDARSTASSNLDEAGAMAGSFAAVPVTTYWTAPPACEGTSLGIQLPDVACAPSIDDEWSITVRHPVSTSRSDARRRYDEMMTVVLEVLRQDQLPSTARVREIITQFRRLNPRRQYKARLGRLARDVAEESSNGSRSSSSSHYIVDSRARALRRDCSCTDESYCAVGGRLPEEFDLKCGFTITIEPAEIPPA